MKRLLAALILLTSVGISFAQHSNGGGGVPGAGGTGSSGFPITLGSTAIAASSTTTTLAGLASLNNVRYLSCSSELGAQVTAAATSLGAAGGSIVFPNCTTATWTTATSQLPPNINFFGYGPRSTQISCSVAGNCLNIHEAVDWTNTSLSIGSQIAGFTMIGTAANASNQVLIAGEGLNGFHIHDIALNGTDATHEPTCLEFRNTATDNTFTERNKTYEVQMGQRCLISVLFQQDASDVNSSFGYNQFEFSIAPTAPNYGVVFNGTANLYNGYLYVYGNHVGSGGGLLQFNGGFSAGGGAGSIPNERLYLAAEEDGSNGTMIQVNGTNSLYFLGDVFNGVAGGLPFPTTAYVAAGATLSITGNYNGQYLIPNDPLVAGGVGYNPGTSIASFTGSWAFGTNLALRNATAGGLEWDEISAGSGSGATAGAYALSNTTSWPFMVFDNNSAAPQVETLSNGVFGWSTTTTGGISTTALNAGISSTASNVIALGNGTQGNTSAVVLLGQLVPTGTTPTMAAGAAAGTSPTCTTVAGTNTSGVLSCTTGTATTASATLATVTFNGTLNTAPQGCTLFPRNANTALAAATIYTTAPSTTTWTIGVSTTALTASTAYVWSFLCL